MLGHSKAQIELLPLPDDTPDHPSEAADCSQTAMEILWALQQEVKEKLNKGQVHSLIIGQTIH